MTSEADMLRNAAPTGEVASPDAVSRGHDRLGSTACGLPSIEAERAREYLLLAALLRAAPNQRLLDGLAGLQGSATPLGLAHVRLAEAARVATASSVATEYMQIFIGVGRGEILPYGSFYLTGFLHERPLARLRADLDRLDIVRQPDVYEPEDHIASLLEVMAGLVGGAFPAGPREADRFFARHIKPFAERLMMDIASAPSARFYKAVGLLGSTWLEIETEVMQLPP